MRKFLRNRAGTAEVIGTIMFVMILMFFFTNVYLWHDAVTKDANQLYLKQVNSTFKIQQTDQYTLVITASGGSDVYLSRIWMDEDCAGGSHVYADLGNLMVAAGQTYNITFTGTDSLINSDQVSEQTQTGSAIVNFNPQTGQQMTYTVTNTVGITESTTYPQTS